MILDMDAGNTRLKWALHDGDIDAAVQFGHISRKQINTALSSFSGLRIDRVRLSSVAGDSTEAISAWAKHRGIVIDTAQVVDRVGGIVCGYRQPERLGKDRWLALLAARKLCLGSYAVADAGTALTLDLVDEDNIHQGGFIVPGLQMMMDSLGANTWGVTIEEQREATTMPGASTSEAVANGCLAAATGLVEKIMIRHGCRTLFLTGGDAGHLAGQLTAPGSCYPFLVVVSPHLVLAGLSVALP